MLEHSCSKSSAMQSYQTITLACLRWKRFTPYWNGNVIFVKFSVMATPEVVKMRIWRSCCLKISAVLFRPRYWQGNGPFKEVVGGVYWFHSVRPSVRLSVCPSRMPCPLCIIYSYGWILFILGTNDHYHERVCRAPWPLTLTYIFKVIRPWLRKSCPLCSVYSSGWILSICGTNDHYH